MLKKLIMIDPADAIYSVYNGKFYSKSFSSSSAFTLLFGFSSIRLWHSNPSAAFGWRRKCRVSFPFSMLRQTRRGYWMRSHYSGQTLRAQHYFPTDSRASYCSVSTLMLKVGPLHGANRLQRHKYVPANDRLYWQQRLSK